VSASVGTARVVALLLGLAMLVAGLAILAIGAGSAASVPGWWLCVFGGALLIGTLIERSRYRSDPSDRTRLPVGPGGGEPPGGALEPRFQRSDEVFIDPTSEHRMRVWIDTSSGERRYVAED
jgi:hypothetical protein